MPWPATGASRSRCRATATAPGSRAPTLRTLKAWSGIPGLRMTLRILAEEFEVVFDHGDAEETRAIAMQSVIEYSDPEDSDYYCSLVLRFIEASETL
ncbi:hypothetical protein ACHFCA_21535 [Delftia tsuruhatensis]